MPNNEEYLSAYTQEQLRLWKKECRRRAEEYRIQRAEEENRYKNIAIDEDLEEARW